MLISALGEIGKRGDIKRSIEPYPTADSSLFSKCSGLIVRVG